MMFWKNGPHNLKGPEWPPPPSSLPSNLPFSVYCFIFYFLPSCHSGCTEHHSLIFVADDVRLQLHVDTHLCSPCVNVGRLQSRKHVSLFSFHPFPLPPPEPPCTPGNGAAEPQWTHKENILHQACFREDKEMKNWGKETEKKCGRKYLGKKYDEEI